MAQFPGVPPIASIIPGFEATTWYGLYAPAGTPDAVVRTINQAYLRMMSDPALQAQLSERGLHLLKRDEYGAQAFQALTGAEVGRWAKVVKAAGIPPQ